MEEVRSIKTELIDETFESQEDFDIIEGDIYDDVSDESDHCNDNEEIVQVEIAAQDLEDFVTELKQIKGLDSQIICDDDGEQEADHEDLTDNGFFDSIPDEPDHNESYDDIFNDNDNVLDDSKEHIFNDNDNVLEDSKEHIKQVLETVQDTFQEVPDVQDIDKEALIPITCLKTETKFDGKKELVLKLHKLDDFLVMKWLKADKNFLKTRFSKLLILKQEGLESNIEATDPLELEDGKFMCGQCKKIYVSKKAVNRHIRQFHQRSQLAQCDHCDYVGASFSSLSFHVQSIHLKMFRYECPQCETVKSQQKSPVVKHLVEDHGVPEVEAKKMVQSKLRLKNRAIGDKHCCDHCDYKSPSKFKLKEHLLRKHADVATFDPDPETTCGLCKEEFINADSKNRHPCPVKSMAVEAIKDIMPDDNGMTTCPLCHDQFINQIQLKEHYAETHVNYVKPKRPLVGLKSKKNDENEEKISEEGNYLCDQCAFYGSKEDLSWHVKQIHKDRQHKCDHCLFSTNSKEVLGNHIKRVHEGIASHMCNLCTVVCWNLKELGEHMREKHWEDTKDFFCTQPACEFWSRQRNRLDKHVQRVHLRQKNFLCDKCEFRAFIQPELDAHIREKHLKIFRFNCHLCHREGIRMGFATRKRLYRHMSFAHNVDPALEDNEENRELILNPPPLLEESVNGDAKSAPGGGVKKSKRGRRKGAKNRLKLDPDTGQLVRTLMKRPRTTQVNGTAAAVQKKTTKKSLPRHNVVVENNVTSTAQAAAILLNEHAASSLWWPSTFQSGSSAQ